MENLIKFDQSVRLKINEQKVYNPSGKLDEHKSTATRTSSDFFRLSDKNLYQLCKTYGERTLEWRRKFAGLLPEVYRRKLYERKGFESIFVFAKKLAGMSEEQVRLVLNLEKRFEKLPILKNLLMNGEVSANKLARVVSIADGENQGFLAENLKILSKAAVETLVRDEKWARGNRHGFDKIDTGNFSLIEREKSIDSKNQNGLFEPGIGVKSLPGQTLGGRNSKTLNLSPEVHARLFELQQKGIDINQLLLEFLEKREKEIQQRKEEVSRKVCQREEEKRAGFSKFANDGGGRSEKLERLKEMYDTKDYILEEPEFLKKQSRTYMARAVKNIIQEEYGTKCAVPNCQKQAEDIHHTLSYAVGRTHDPKFLVPLCKAHHELEHTVNENYALMKNLAKKK